VKRRLPEQEPEPAPGFRGTYKPDNKVIAIGSSTGGVEALIAVLTRFPANCAPTLITQHMPPVFTRNLAQRLDRMCAPQVLEATHGAPLRSGTVYLAPGGDMHLEVSSGGQACVLKPGGPVNGHCPSVDRLFSSVARNVGSAAWGATGRRAFSTCAGQGPAPSRRMRQAPSSMACRALPSNSARPNTSIPSPASARRSSRPRRPGFSGADSCLTCSTSR